MGFINTLSFAAMFLIMGVLLYAASDGPVAWVGHLFDPPAKVAQVTPQPPANPLAIAAR